MCATHMAMAGQDFRPADVMRAMREVMGELGEEAGPHSRPVTYVDANGRQRPMIEFSEDGSLNLAYPFRCHAIKG
jgi:hypothetical protein